MPKGIYDRKGYKHSEETKRKIGKANSIKLKEFYNKNPNIAKERTKKAYAEGKKFGFQKNHINYHTEESRRKIGLANKNHPKYKNPERNKKISISSKGKIISKETREKIRKTVLKYIKDNPEKVKEQIKRTILSGRRKSKYQKRVEDLLQNNNINIISEYRIERFFYDIYIPKQNLLIEIDGEYWHNYPHGTDKDKLKNKIAEKYGFNLIRFWCKSIDQLNDMEILKQIVYTEFK